MTSFYQVLGLETDATPDDIRQAYRKLSMKFHPDKNQGDKYFEEWTKKVNTAYETLGNPAKKAAYDSKLEEETRRRESSENHRSETNPDHEELALLKDIRRQLPIYFDAWNDLRLAQSNFEFAGNQESPIIITIPKGIICGLGIVAALGGLWYTLVHGH